MASDLRVKLQAWQKAALIVVFPVTYYLLGLAGLATQSAQTGVTPMWPASGVAFALCFWFGGWYAWLVMPAMFALAYSVGLSETAAALSGFGSVLEILVPLYLLRRLGFDPRLASVRDVLLFFVAAVMFGPVLSASIGTVAMMTAHPGGLAALQIWTLWWLGNSLGILIVGGLGLVAPYWRADLKSGARVPELVLMLLLVALMAVSSVLQQSQVTSSLVAYLLVPAFLMLALRSGQFGVFSAGLVAVATFLVASGKVTATHPEYGDVFLHVSLLWFTLFTGIMVSAAFSERSAREQMAWLATHDSLTRLTNRHEFLQRLKQAMNALTGNDVSHGLIYLDLDKFKAVNDSGGHNEGDRLLSELAQVLKKEVRGRDTLARIGGDEFAVLLEYCPLIEACGIAENLRRAVEEFRFECDGDTQQISVSVGVTLVDEAATDVLEVLRQADHACYEAKRAGRNTVWVDAV